jgi:hypothetical protein
MRPARPESLRPVLGSSRRSGATCERRRKHAGLPARVRPPRDRVVVGRQGGTRTWPVGGGTLNEAGMATPRRGRTRQGRSSRRAWRALIVRRPASAFRRRRTSPAYHESGRRGWTCQRPRIGLPAAPHDAGRSTGAGGAEGRRRRSRGECGGARTDERESTVRRRTAAEAAEGARRAVARRSSPCPARRWARGARARVGTRAARVPETAARMALAVRRSRRGSGRRSSTSCRSTLFATASPTVARRGSSARPPVSEWRPTMACTRYNILS